MGFSADWLALREPADMAARDVGLLQRAAQLAGPAPVILDLGCGTGATMRALAAHLPQDTRWRLLDSSGDLLAYAKAVSNGQAETFQQDLMDVEALPLDGVTLVTASALLDLVSEAWLWTLARRLKVPFYAALSYNGEMHWTPADKEDAEITRFFNQHQRSDKGFGPALGPDAASRAEAILTKAGFDVHLAYSPWQIGPDMAQLNLELTNGIGAAAQEAGAADASAWARSKNIPAQATRCVIGHVDLLAIPREE